MLSIYWPVPSGISIQYLPVGRAINVYSNIFFVCFMLVSCARLSISISFERHKIDSRKENDQLFASPQVFDIFILCAWYLSYHNEIRMTYDTVCNINNVYPYANICDNFIKWLLYINLWLVLHFMRKKWCGQWFNQTRWFCQHRYMHNIAISKLRRKDTIFDKCITYN